MLGLTEEKFSVMLYPLVEAALPENVLKSWERYRINFYEMFQVASSMSNVTVCEANQLSLLMRFLENEVECNRRMQWARVSDEGNDEGSDEGEGYEETLVSMISRPTPNCIFCQSKWMMDMILGIV